MEITNVNVRKLCNEVRMKAICSVTFDDMLVIHDLKVIESDEKIFVAMPSRKNKLGQYTDIAHPITAELRTKLEQEVLGAYRQAIEETAE